MRKVLIIGGTGMLGHALLMRLSLNENLDVYATVRSPDGLLNWFSQDILKNISVGLDANNFDSVVKVFAEIQPEIVINCIGLTDKTRYESDLLSLITVNARFPHQLAYSCQAAGARLIHISTDGVFDGKKGMYTEKDEININDIYGMSKFLGEVRYHNCLTLRTSIIGHELRGKKGLIEWFLTQKEKVKGFTNAIYSGLPTTEFARIINDYVLPNDSLAGIYHVSSEPISKYALLQLVADRYNKKIEIEIYEDYVINRSLDSTAFRFLTGYNPPHWNDLIDAMYYEYIDRKRM